MMALCANPRTLSHAQAAKVPVIVAVNKSDHPNADPMKVRQQLQDKGLVCEEWGGNTIFVDVSALAKQGIDKLLEMIVLQADVQELKANHTRAAKGNVIESASNRAARSRPCWCEKDAARGAIFLICGQYWGKVRALINEEGQRLKEAGPSVAVKVLGMNGVPEAGWNSAWWKATRTRAPWQKNARNKPAIWTRNAVQGHFGKSLRNPRLRIEQNPQSRRQGGRARIG